MEKNITTLLREIKDLSGWSEPKIATAIGTSQPTVNRILNGQTDCKGSTLRAIEDLHLSICAQAKPPAVPAARRATDPHPNGS